MSKRAKALLQMEEALEERVQWRDARSLGILSEDSIESNLDLINSLQLDEVNFLISVTVL